MESRILSSGATAISGVPRFTKLAGRIATTTTVAVASPARLNTTGGNVVWGRQLRPSLLNLDHSSPVTLVTKPEKRDVLKPCTATASDSAGDAAPVGFFAKYPFLVTGFFFFMWYFLNVIFNILNKKIYNYFPYPYFVSAIHLAVGVVYCLGGWAVGIPKRAVSLTISKNHAT